MYVRWGGFGMKNVSKRQYILTLIVSFAAIVVLSLCTIMTFYRKSVNDTMILWLWRQRLLSRSRNI